MTPAEPVRAPAGAVGWTPADGFVYEADDMPRRVHSGSDMVLVVSDDGLVRGVTSPALVAVLRLDADLAEVVQRLGDVADHAAGMDVSEAVYVAALHARVTALRHRVDQLERGTS